MRTKFLKLVPFCLMFALLSYGCVQQTATTRTTAQASEQKKDGQVYKGKVIGKSNKAKTISIQVGKGDKAKTIMVKFDDKTKGVEHASPGHASIIAYEMRNGEPWATVVKPKLAKLPKGVSEIKTDEIKAIIEDGQVFTLIDARPTKRYNAGHMPGAVSISVADYKDNKKKVASLLPKDKNQLLVFYCGGPT